VSSRAFRHIKYKMRIFVLIIISTLLSTLSVTAQQLNLTIEGGINTNFSNQIDIHISPDFTVLSIGNQLGGKLLFTPRKSHLSFGTGLYVDKQSNVTGLSIFYPFGFESLRPIRTHYNSIKIPLIIAYNIGIETKNKKKLDWSGFVMFSQHRNQDDFQLNDGRRLVTAIDGDKFDLNYWTYKSTFAYTTYSIESGFRLTFPLQQQINLTASLSYKMGLQPVFTTYVEINMDAHIAENTSFNADLFNVNKGDAVLFNVGLSYDFSLKKKRD